MSSEIALEVNGLSKCYHIYKTPKDRFLQFIFNKRKQYYKEFWALKELSFVIRKGETVGFIGKNGSGKSTLLQLICGTLNPSTGTIGTHGRVAALLELGSGFNPEFTGRENVYLNAEMLGLSKDEIHKRFDLIARFADIGDFIEQPVKTYSSGMYVRLAFAVIAHVDADILVIDEALAVGDAVFTQKCMRFLRQFQKTGAVLFVSHDIGALHALCQRAYWLDKGTLKMSGEPKDVSAAYLAAIYEEQQGTGTQQGLKDKSTAPPPSSVTKSRLALRDMRLDFVNHSKFRNDIELFTFKEDADSFGKGEARIEAVRLLDQDHRALQWVVGGEPVVLEIVCRSHKELFSPIVGFFLKDRLGQPLFGDNTYLTYMTQPLSISAEIDFVATFSFSMPLLPVGDYSINVALAEGNQHEHVQHHWIHDAMTFRSVSSSITTGLIGIPMHAINLKTINP